MRETKFRARRKSDGEWCRGDLSVGEDTAYILSGWPLEVEKLSALAKTYSLRVQGQINECDLKTVGEYTGLKDKNGVEIFEGDIVTAPNIERPMIVFYSPQRAAYRMGTRGDKTQFDKQEPIFDEDYCEVLGNIYSNPELLTREDK